MQALEEMSGARIWGVGVGPGREQTIVVHEPDPTSDRGAGMADDLSSLRIAVTGGARGIGRATAARLAGAGARVVIGDRDHDVAATVAAELGHGVTAAAPRCRGSRVAGRRSSRWRGRSTCSSTTPGSCRWGRSWPGARRSSPGPLDVNLMGVVHGTKAVAPGMAERGGGQIVNVASAVGRVAAAGGATYTASKFAVVGFSEATRAELEPLGCRGLPGDADRGPHRPRRRRAAGEVRQAGAPGGRRGGDRGDHPEAEGGALGARAGPSG